MGSCFSLEGRTPIPSSPTSPTGGIQKWKPSYKKKLDLTYWREEPLHKIPGRLYMNGSNEFASLFTMQGKKGTNQDAMIVWDSRKDTVFCGVFDGHGPNGHLVAKRVRDSLPVKLSSHWKVNVNGEDVLREISTKSTVSQSCDGTPLLSVSEESRTSVELEDNEKHPEIFQSLKESFLKAFRVMDRELRMHPNIDCYCSGTTAVTLVKQGKHVVLGNIGDSRAVLGTRDEDGSLVAVQLTVDLKPNIPAEAERIRKYKGRVFALQGEPEVARVWLPNALSPGLAMARAFGDFCLKDFGLISVPEVSYRCIGKKDEFIVLATDGIWDVLSNKEVVDIIASAPARSSAARSLVENAVRAWRYKYPTSKVDDCAVVCLFLDSDSLSTASNSKPNEQQPSSMDQAKTTTEGSKDDASESENVDTEGDWSALEGVSRLNTLLNLPSYVPGKDEKQAS
ncbi:hypothetical protein CRG98_012667 [Punica granatum]|uniref:protein-serine/threonine phosphatase n=1 Tax=Punica granatum TaxID=22663 RepID=A0A2I0KEH0_PUNGR|nr:hypothetical protein CRG98_012667 [Punica granatum]